jgi:hypothetical protein
MNVRFSDGIAMVLIPTPVSENEALVGDSISLRKKKNFLSMKQIYETKKPPEGGLSLC